MAHQDYVSRSKNKKKNPYKPKAKAKPTAKASMKVKLIALLLVIAIPSFIYLLWTIKDKAPSTTTNTSTVAKPDTKPQVSLPKPPTEKWTYVEELKKKEVEVGQYEVTKKGPYKMQCGSFKTQKQANTLKAKIAFAGLEAQVSRVKGSSAIWHKVFLGPYTKKRAAEKDRHRLKNNGIHGCKIWNWD